MSTTPARLWPGGGAPLCSGIEAVARTPEQVATLLAAGEDVVACETLCENLYEADTVVARGLLSSLRATALRSGADMALIEILLT